MQVLNFFQYIGCMKTTFTFSADQLNAINMNSTIEQNKAIVARFNEEFIEEGNMQTFNEIMDRDFINQTAPAGVPKGPEGVLYFFNQFLKSAFPDLKVVIHEQVAGRKKIK